MVLGWHPGKGSQGQGTDEEEGRDRAPTERVRWGRHDGIWDFGRHWVFWEPVVSTGFRGDCDQIISSSVLTQESSPLISRVPRERRMKFSGVAGQLAVTHTFSCSA
jgi:hypothetical protein